MTATQLVLLTRRAIQRPTPLPRTVNPAPVVGRLCDSSFFDANDFAFRATSGGG